MRERRWFGALVGLAVLVAAFAAGDSLVRATHLPLPGNVVGMLVLLALLGARIIPRAPLEAAADLLLRHLPLLFVPAAVGVARHVGLIRAELGAVVTITVLTTALVMVVTGRIARATIARGGDEPR